MPSSSSTRPTVAEALRDIADATTLTESLRVRTEGLTWIIWGFAVAGQYLSFSLTNATEGAQRGLSGGPFLILAWTLAAILATIGSWRSAALSFTTGMTTRRTSAFFALWIALLLGGSVAFSVLGGASRAVASAAAWSVLLILFAAANPMRFTTSGRSVALAAGLVALVGSGVAWNLSLVGSAATLLSAATLGGALLVGGLVILFRG